MAKSGLSLTRLSILLLMSTFCTAWSLPASSKVDLVQEHEPTDETVDVDRKGHDDNKPIYEFQLAVWPDEFVGAVPGMAGSAYAPQFEDQEVVFPDLTDSDTGVSQVMPSIPTWHNPQTAAKPPPQSDVMPAIFPDIHFDEAEAIADHVQDNAVVTQKPMVSKPHVEVVEQYQVVHPNGTTEYKLVLSNGMANYKKIYNKLMPNRKVVTVQEGYDTVPIPGDDPYSNGFQTQYYIADEHGNNVYKSEMHTRKLKLPHSVFKV